MQCRSEQCLFETKNAIEGLHPGSDRARGRAEVRAVLGEVVREGPLRLRADGLRAVLAAPAAPADLIKAYQ